MKLSEVWPIYEQDKTIEGYSRNTIKAYKLQFRMLCEYLGDVNVDDVTTFHLKSYIQKRSAELKPNSLQHTVKFIRAVFRYMHEEGLTDSNVSAKIKFPKGGHRVPKFIAEETLELLRINAKDSLDAALIEFMYSSGCRIGEVYGLNKKDFDFHRRTVTVTGKGDKEREVYFSKRAEIWIKRYFDSRKDDQDCFVCKRNRPYNRMSIHQMRLRMKEVAKRAGVDENVYPHKLRHTYATHLVNRGAPIEVIQQFLGHSKLDTTMVYAHLSGEHRKKVYEQYF
ncbi:tyrosine-type recombinase/integrase [Salipaludibacillus aurantiacus]|uniref:Integrase/recombinase XerD n=1 Tax=Salipaludibacillus aurantiacus TaxID=1601833 RepID=A0A1H9TZW5_9BACI|nr:tyrosine-type recombinase/integrase [Salipaludibacillus aurantiacus]SES02447.1 integrase/recombinase XerD [Salipaludibacillus aurantiacus]